MGKPLASEPSAPYLEQSQSKLVSEYLESRTQPERLKFFKDTHWLSEISETYWLARIEGQPPPKVSQNTRALMSELRRVIAQTPHRIDQIILISIDLVQTSWRHPIASLSAWGETLLPLAIPMMWSLLLLALLQIYFWHPAIRRDLELRLRTTKVIPLWISLGISAFLAVHYGLLTVWAFTVSLGGYLYSQPKRPWLILTVLFALWISFLPLKSAILESADDLIPAEALRSGRTSLAYSPSATQWLKPEEKALWAYWNGDDSLSRYWLQQSPQNWFKNIFEINLGYNPAMAPRARDQYQKLVSASPQDSLLIYNLMQIETQLQNLVAADELRARIPIDDLQYFSTEAPKVDRLVMPYPRDLFVRFLDRLVFHLKDAETPRWQLAIQYAWPWALLFIAFLISISASGLCIYTGMATPSQSESLSHLALLYQEKSDSLEPAARQKYNQEVRQFDRWKRSGIKWSSWVLPGSYWLGENRPLLAYLLSLPAHIALWLCLPASLQTPLQELFGLPTGASLSVSGLSFPLFILSLLLAFLIGRSGRSRVEA